VLETHSAQGGFNLIEVMVSLTVLAILIALGAPSFGEWLQNQQIRAATEAMVNGMQVARGEAIKRNLAVQFTLDLPSGWTVCEATKQPCDGTLLADPVRVQDVIQSRSGSEGTRNATATSTPGGALAVTFSPLGGVVANADNPVTASITQVDVVNTQGNCMAAGGAMRCLRVVVTGGGSIRMCDPTPGIVAPDTRACP
jgi:type IV fimbrial biogenesis protein FimT